MLNRLVDKRRSVPPSALAGGEEPAAADAPTENPPWGWLAVVVVTLGGLYAATLLRDVGFETDTAKFQYLGRVLGTAHQPGYPMFTALLALAVRLIPFGGDALRVDLLSATFGIATCAVCLFVLLELRVRRVLACTAALLIGVTETFWLESVVIEVYTLQTLFAAVVLWLLVRWQRSRADRDLVLALAVYALSLAHTPATILLAPGIALFLGLVDWRAPLRWRIVRWIPLFALLALGPYAYIVWRSFDPSNLYYEVQIRSVGDLLSALRGTHYRDMMWSFGPQALVAERIPMLRDLLRDEPLWWAVPVALVGLVRLRLRPINLLLATWWVAVTLWGLEYDVGDVFVFFILTYFILVLWASVGFDWIAESLLARMPPVALTPARVMVGALVLLAPLLVARSNFDQVDFSDDPTGQEIRSALAAMPDGGVVFSYHYHHFNYELIGRGRQAELNVYSQYPGFERIGLYCQGKQIGLGGVVGHAPSGLPAYAYGAAYLPMLRGEGFTLIPVSGELVRIDCARLPPQHVPTEDLDPSPRTPHNVRG
ncbi:MAG: protein O-mannosyl-transferase family [Nitriliruptorales bacterium]